MILGSEIIFHNNIIDRQRRIMRVVVIRHVLLFMCKDKQHIDT